MGGRALAILWAQWRTLINHLPRSSATALAFSSIIAILWYGAAVVLSVASALLMSSPTELSIISQILPGGLLLGFLYWQIVPLLLASSGASLDIRKLIAYPIPHRELFALEVLLRFSTGIEIVIVLLGTGIGLLVNPRIPGWAPIGLLIFAVFNLFFAIGVRDVAIRLFARKFLREVFVFLFVIAAALPQLLIASGISSDWKILKVISATTFWPWIAAAGLATGHTPLNNLATLAGWTVAAYLFGRSQFERGLRFDAQEKSAERRDPAVGHHWTDRFFRWPALLFPDPLAALIEKELRFLTRSARFRLVFLMGFSFGLLIWIPVTFGRTSSPDSWSAQHYLTLVCLYALMLLSDVLLWNAFGFDRSAAGIYYLAPVRMQTVLLAKNITALVFITLEILAVSTVCAILRLPMNADRILEAYTVAVTVALFLMAVGNLSSMYNPKPVDPAKSFRASAGRQTQAALMLFLPVSALPAALAFLAEYAFSNRLAFYAVLIFFQLLGVVVYRIATETAIELSDRRKEAILHTLGGGSGPISS